jgi:hypothetical protein
MSRQSEGGRETAPTRDVEDRCARSDRKRDDEELASAARNVPAPPGRATAPAAARHPVGAREMLDRRAAIACLARRAVGPRHDQRHSRLRRGDQARRWDGERRCAEQTRAWARWSSRPGEVIGPDSPGVPQRQFASARSGRHVRVVFRREWREAICPTYWQRFPPTRPARSGTVDLIPRDRKGCRGHSASRATTHAVSARASAALGHIEDQQRGLAPR